MITNKANIARQQFSLEITVGNLMNPIEGNYYVYITTNPGRTTLYIGVTNDLQRRMFEHYKNRGNPDSFAGNYYCHKLIYYEYFTDIKQAIMREKELKKLSRKAKQDLIARVNPK